MKQIDQFGPSGETIVDYAIYDAIACGFNKIIFVIRKNIENEFREVFLEKLSDKANVSYVFQELDSIPKELPVPVNREKPWGTGHAVMMAKDEISEPFAIVNADDFYGRGSLKLIHDHLSQLDNTKLSGTVVGYPLLNTLSDHGKVSRGICEIGSANELVAITERTDIYKTNEGIYYQENEVKYPLTGQETVSMNLMGFTSEVFTLIEKWFVDFYHESYKNLKSEFYIPSVLNSVIHSGGNVSVIPTNDQWFGVTYKEDKPIAQRKLTTLVNEGVYPKRLWS